MMSGSSSSVSDWLGSASRQKIQIWCEDPEASSEKIAGGVIEKTYLTYKLLMKQPGRDISGIVRHRYSEFEALRSNLRDRYYAVGVLLNKFSYNYCIYLM